MIAIDLVENVNIAGGDQWKIMLFGGLFGFFVEVQ